MKHWWLRIGVCALLLIIFAAGAIRLYWDPIADYVFERFARQVFADPEMLRDGALHVFLCGTAGPVGGPDQRSACSAVVADGEMLLVDAGSGGPLYAGARGMPMRQLSTILVTHLHHDHISGLADAIHGSWFIGRTRPIAVYGPPGIDRVMRGLSIAYAEDRRLRQLPGGGGLDARWAIPSVHVVEIPDDESVLVFERGRLRVRAFRVDHGPIAAAYGYRIELADRAAVFNGDGRADERTIQHAKGADLLVHGTIPFQWAMDAERLERTIDRLDVNFPDAQRVTNLFSNPVDIARAAQAAGVASLVFSHRMPTPSALNWLALWGVSDVYEGTARMGDEGMRFTFETSGPNSAPE